MPTVAIVAGVSVMFFFNDHDPAHFHAEYGGEEMKVRISDLTVMDGALPPAKRRAVLAWAATRQEALALAWVRCREMQRPGRIA